MFTSGFWMPWKGECYGGFTTLRKEECHGRFMTFGKGDYYDRNGCIYNAEGRQYSKRPLTTTGKIEMHKLLLQFDAISIYDKMYFAISSDT